MKTRIKRSVFPLLGISLSLAGCADFDLKEHCTYRGDVEFRLDWESFWGTLERPKELHVEIKDAKGAYRNLITGEDTVVHDLAAGRLTALLYNRADGVEYKGFPDGEREISLPTYLDGYTRRTESAPLICTYKVNAEVPVAGVKRLIVSPRPVIKRLNFRVYLFRDGSVPKVSLFRGEVTGLSTLYSVRKNTPLRSKATIAFDMEKSVRESTGNPEVFRYGFYTFGAPPASPGEDIIENLFRAKVVLEDGTVHTAEADLTGYLARLKEPVGNCALSVRVSSAGLSVEITTWEEGDWGTGFIQ